MRIIIRWPLRGPSGQRRAAGQRAPFRRRRSALRADSLRCSVCGHVAPVNVGQHQDGAFPASSWAG